MKVSGFSLSGDSALRLILLNAIAVLFVVLVPAISHFSGYPFYFMEPMRLMLVFILMSSGRVNAFIVAALLPVVSYLVSGHPVPVKMLIIIGELLLNTWFFVLLLRRGIRPYISIFISVLASKLICYLAYWIVFSWEFVVDESQPVFILAQFIVTLLISTAVFIYSLKKPVSI